MDEQLFRPPLPGEPEAVIVTTDDSIPGNGIFNDPFAEPFEL
jgi:hypothetical protein